MIKIEIKVAKYYEWAGYILNVKDNSSALEVLEDIKEYVEKNYEKNN